MGIFQKYSTFLLWNKLLDVEKMLVINFDTVLNWQEIIKKFTGTHIQLNFSEHS